MAATTMSERLRQKGQRCFLTEVTIDPVILTNVGEQSMERLLQLAKFACRHQGIVQWQPEKTPKLPGLRRCRLFEPPFPLNRQEVRESLDEFGCRPASPRCAIGFAIARPELQVERRIWSPYNIIRDPREHKGILCLDCKDGGPDLFILSPPGFFQDCFVLGVEI